MQLTNVNLEGGSILRAMADSVGMHLSGKLLVPDDSGYDEARQVWNGFFDRRPDVIAQCQSATDVGLVISFLQASGLPFAVKGGGHSFAGFSAIDGGVLVDLSELKAVTVDHARGCVTAGPGVVIKDLDAATCPYGLAVPLGTVGSTGIAGLTLSGGVGWLTRQHGLTCDSLLRAEVVTASGRCVRASASDNPDLFWALRGGGGNFGVVTAFEYQLHPVGDVEIEISLYALTDGRRVLDAWRHLIARLPEHVMTYALLLRIPRDLEMPGLAPDLYDRDLWAILVKSPAERGLPDHELASLRAAAPALYRHIRQYPYQALNSAFDALAPPRTRQYMKSAMLREIPVDLLVQIAAHKPDTRATLEIPALGGAVRRLPDDATAFAHRDGAAVIGLGAYDDDPGTFPQDQHWVRSSWAMLQPYTLGFYANYEADDEHGRLQAHFGDAKYARLQAAKRTWDPGNIFCRNQNIPPDLSST